jgi:hypothetical protein
MQVGHLACTRPASGHVVIVPVDEIANMTGTDQASMNNAKGTMQLIEQQQS